MNRRTLVALKQSWPIYVTNKNADGVTATYSLNSGWALAIMFLFGINAVLWGAIGVVEAVRVIL